MMQGERRNKQTKTTQGLFVFAQKNHVYRCINLNFPKQLLISIHVNQTHFPFAVPNMPVHRTELNHAIVLMDVDTQQAVSPVRTSWYE